MLVRGIIDYFRSGNDYISKDLLFHCNLTKNEKRIMARVVRDLVNEGYLKKVFNLKLGFRYFIMSAITDKI